MIDVMRLSVVSDPPAATTTPVVGAACAGTAVRSETTPTVPALPAPAAHLLKVLFTCVVAPFSRLGFPPGLHVAFGPSPDGPFLSYEDGADGGDRGTPGEVMRT